MLFFKELVYIFFLFFIFFYSYRTVLLKLFPVAVNKYWLHLILMSVSCWILTYLQSQILFREFGIRIDFLASSALPIFLITELLLIIFILRAVIVFVREQIINRS